MKALRGLAAAAALGLASLGCGRPGAPAARPNIVFVLTDDQRWDAMSLQGNSGPLKTPNIDRLGHEGIYFRNAFATTALCSPSYTPNVRALRTGEWKYVRYPNSPSPHMAELYHLTDDPDELVNLINDPRYRYRVVQLHAELDRQLIALGAWPDRMPLDEGIGQQLPDARIR